MPIKAVRTINPTQVRNFGRFGDAVDVPPLTDVQTKSYDRFLQLDTLPEKRTATGLVLNVISPDIPPGTDVMQVAKLPS